MERLARWIAWKLPREVVKWAYYRVLANATQGKWSSKDVPSWKEAADRWGLKP